MQGLSPKQREPIDQCTTSLAKHVPSLTYPDSLAKGYPIATGVIEGACRYLVKDRMEITGASRAFRKFVTSSQRLFQCENMI